MQTSAGWAVVQIEVDVPGFGDLAVTALPYDEEGWELSGKTWSAAHGHHGREETLPQFLAAVLEIPAAEADRLAAEIQGPWLDEWERRGGREEARALRRGTFVLLTAVVTAVLLSLTAVALIIWLAVR